MKAKTWIENAREILAPMGLSVDTWSPGDGETRYRFLPMGHEYFSHEGIGTLYGKKAADDFLTGLVQGFERGKPDPLFFWNLGIRENITKKKDRKKIIGEIVEIFFSPKEKEEFLKGFEEPEGK
ncbi:MAG: hypothetical protein M0R06_23425 [Sphaerochaeta sp.]|jgi:hypothetical protein|nr:hypothetical protein [Sphaerochaeta sp.]